MLHLYPRAFVVLTTLSLVVACGSSDANNGAANGGSSGSTAANGGSNATAGASGANAGSSSSSAGAGNAGGSSSGAGGAAGSSGSAGAAGSGGSAMSDCSPPADVFNPIATLSQTGCVDPNDPRKPIARAVSYEVNSPLWSDSADKQRAFVLPPGGKIHVRDCAANMAVDCPNGVEDDGRWNFPVGTVMIKIFMFDDKLVETRLFMLLDPDNWIGYSYEWDEGQTDAKITTSDRAEVMFNTGTRTVDWHYPSQQDCLTCHNPGAGFTLGPETAQLNRNVAGTMMNQIDQMAALGVFETAPAKPYKAALVTPYTSQAGNAGGTTTQQARSYLHANCGFCHRPGGAYSVFDLRNDTALKDTNICNVDIQKPPIPSAPNSTKILAPGSAMDSVMWQRMNVADPDVGRMPQIASYAVDTNATQVVGDWINSLKLADCTQ